ncbi:MAG: hypothetical protein HEQ23_09925 [Tepidisphaera sp.]
MQDSEFVGYPVDIETVWLAVDRDEHLAAFYTSGNGPIPLAVLEATNVPAVTQTWSRLKALAQRRNVRLDCADPYGKITEVAQRGLYVYAWSSGVQGSPGKFEREGSPVTPLRLADFPEDIRMIASLSFRFPMSFAQLSVINDVGWAGRSLRVT